MSLVKKETKMSQVKIKYTAPLSLPLFTENDPVARVERRLQAFIANSDWIYDSLNLIDKALNNITELNTFDNWVLNRLDLNAKTVDGSFILTDRYNSVLSLDMLNTLREKIITLSVNYASKLIKRPDLHHMEKTFKKALRKSSTNKLTEEETNVLKEAYLKLENGKVFNLKGQMINIPKFNFLRLLIA